MKWSVNHASEPSKAFPNSCTSISASVLLTIWSITEFNYNPTGLNFISLYGSPILWWDRTDLWFSLSWFSCMRINLD